MRYEFDTAKQAANVAKHGAWFDQADQFEWETAVIEVDTRRRYAETRFAATGHIGLRLFVLVFTLRKANQREVKHYAET